MLCARSGPGFRSARERLQLMRWAVWTAGISPLRRDACRPPLLLAGCYLAQRTNATEDWVAGMLQWTPVELVAPGVR